MELILCVSLNSLFELSTAFIIKDLLRIGCVVSRTFYVYINFINLQINKSSDVV